MPQKTETILDLENWSAQGATAELIRKTLTVRLAFRLNDPPELRLISVAGKANKSRMVPNLLVIEYGKHNEETWQITGLRVYGDMVGEPKGSAVNIYPHDHMGSTIIPAWIRDAAFKGKPA